MTNRIKNFVCAALLIVSISGAAIASDARETPLVRAVKRAKASVVNIHTEKTSTTGDPLFSSNKGRRVNGMGTGIVVDERGYIVTNHHVVKGVDLLRVTLIDGSTYTARVISYDRKHDLAIIKVDPSKPLQVMPMGTSSDIMLGETVVAVGNAFGYEHTVTSGIVSSLSRDVEVNEKQSYENLIQTDASINPGNSGGPLLNLDGEVVGINVAIRAGAQRIGFAIPIDDARKTIAKLLNIGHLNKTRHGVRTNDLKSGKKRMLVVDTAEKDSPAAKAGFKAGDVIIKAGETKVVDGVDFERALLGLSAGEEVDVIVRRDGKNESLSLKLAELGKVAGTRGQSEALVKAPGADDKSWELLGLKLGKLSETALKTVGPRYRGGMKVIDVRPSSPAADNGIQKGDVLVGLHIWETISGENIDYVLEHPKFRTFSPLKFYILRGRETLYGHLQMASGGN